MAHLAGQSAVVGSHNALLTDHGLDRLQIAAVAATVASAITLLVNQPLSHSLYPPPSFALFIILITTLSTISTFSFLRFTLETGANEDRLVHVSLAVVPRALLTMMLAHLARRNGGSRGSVELSFTLASGLVGWAWVSTGVGEEAEDDDEVEGSRGRRRSSTSRSSSITPLPRSPSLSSKTSAMHDACHSPRRPSLIALLPLLPFLYVLVHSIHPLSVPYLASTSISTYYANRIGLHLKAATPFTPPTMDLVFSYYNEDLLPFSEHIQAMRNLSVVQRHRARAIVYSKDEKEEFVTRAALEAIPGVDEVVVLPNFGREGEWCSWRTKVAIADPISDRRRDLSHAHPPPLRLGGSVVYHRRLDALPATS